MIIKIQTYNLVIWNKHITKMLKYFHINIINILVASNIIPERKKNLHVYNYYNIIIFYEKNIIV
jgi:hypothetical protein